MKRLIVIITRLSKSNVTSLRDPSRPPIPARPRCVQLQPEIIIIEQKEKILPPPVIDRKQNQKAPGACRVCLNTAPPNLNRLCHRIIIASNEEMSLLPAARGEQYRPFPTSPFTNRGVKGQSFVFPVRRILTAGLICLSVCV